MLLALATIFAAAGAPDYGNKLQQTLGSAKAAMDSGKHDAALEKLDEMQRLMEQWRAEIKTARDAPPQEKEIPKPPEESIEYEMTVTHKPDKCRRKSEEGSTMRVHYVGKLIKTGKIFGSSFHTGSQPKKFTLGSDEVLAAWNKGLTDMCEGERRRLRVPWQEGYGAEGAKGVPPYSDLQYDFELVEVSNPKIPRHKKEL